MNHRPALSPNQLQTIRSRYLAGETTEQLAASFAVEPAVVRRVVRGLAKQRPPTSTDIERFWAKVDRSGGPYACWHWQGGQAKGRGQFCMQGTTYQAHRLAYQLTYGPIPPRQELTPECGNWLCVNPDHFVMDVRRLPHSAGEAHGQAKLNDAQIAAIRSQHAAGGVTLQALADAFGVNESTIRKYLRGERRRTAPGPIAPPRPNTRLAAAPPPGQQRRRAPEPSTQLRRVRPSSRSATTADVALRPQQDQPVVLPDPKAAPPAAPLPTPQPQPQSVQLRGGLLEGSRKAVAPRVIDGPRLLVAAVDDLATQVLETHLQDLGYHIVGIIRRADELIRFATQHKPDLILLDRRLIPRDEISSITSLTTQQSAPVVLLDTHTDRNALRRAAAAGAFGYLVLPVSPDWLEITITVALARAADIQTVRNQVHELQESLETRKVVERAKGILMRRHDLDENDAYTRLQQYARDRRITLRKVAETLIAADRELGV